MLAILPVAAWVAIFLALGNSRPAWGWGRSFLRSAIGWGSYLILGTELLSLFHWITPLGLSVFWLVGIVGAGWVLARVRRAAGGIEFPPLRLPKVWTDRLLLGVVLAALVLTGIVAWLAPPQTWDSLTYHTARVAHWAQNQSLSHYATGIERQNLMSPGAEILVLHTYVLAGGDRLANFVEWGSMLLCLLGVAIIAGQLGVGPSGRWLAAVFVATLPMGIAQASSTMTDYVVALWMVAVASEAIHLSQSEPNSGGVAFLGAATGLAILTKPTAFAYLLPFAGYVAGRLAKTFHVPQIARWTTMVVGLILVINVGYLGRNLVTYGHVLGGRGKVSTHSNQIFNLGVIFSNTLRNASLHAGTPWEGVNHQIWRGIVGIHFKLGMDVNDPRTSIHQSFQILPPKPEEVRSGNPLHALLILVSVAVLAILHLFRRGAPPRLVAYALVVALTFVVLSALFRFTVFGSRYHLPFFVLMAPVAAAAFERLVPRPILGGVGLLLFVTSWPYFVRMDVRPILPDRDGRSVFTTDRADLYLGPSLTYSYHGLTEAIAHASCQSVGVMLGGDTAEYPLWPFLGAPRRGLTIEWIVAGTPSERYRRPSFEPCAVVCDGSCPSEWTTVGDLPLRLDLAGYRLFLAP